MDVTVPRHGDIAHLPVVSLCRVIPTAVIVPVVLHMSAEYQEVSSCREKQVGHELGLCTLSQSSETPLRLAHH